MKKLLLLSALLILACSSDDSDEAGKLKSALGKDKMKEWRTYKQK